MKIKSAKFAQQMAKEYVSLTETTKFTEADLAQPQKMTVAHGTPQFLVAIRQVESNFQSCLDQWGYTHFSSGRVFIDLEALRDRAQLKTTQAGLALIDAFWHEWGTKILLNVLRNS